MELRHLRYFVAVVDHGSFSAASRELHIAQSAISEQIADMEAEIGVPLLARNARRATVTDAGASFLEESRHILASANHAVELARRVSRGLVGTLRIGFFAGGMDPEFPELIRSFRKQYPDVQFSLFEMTAVQQCEALLQGSIDLGFTRRLEPEYRNDLQSIVLRHDPIMAILPRGHKAAPGPIDLRDLANEPFVISSRETSPATFDKVIELCSEAGFSPRIASVSSVWTSVVLMVQAGVGIALLPSNEQRFSTNNLAFCPLKARHASVEFVMAWSKKRDNALARSFRAMALNDRKPGSGDPDPTTLPDPATGTRDRNSESRGRKQGTVR